MLFVFSKSPLSFVFYRSVVLSFAFRCLDRRFASSYNDFVPASNCGYTVKIKKEAEVWQLLATIEIELGIPIDRMRLWNVEQRDNHSRRPMDCLEAENLTDIVAKKYTSESNNGRCVFNMEVGAGVECMRTYMCARVHTRSSTMKLPSPF